MGNVKGGYKGYATKEKYLAAKRKKYDSYYRATAIYKRRMWDSYEEIEVIEQDCTDRELSNRLCRSIKAIEHKRRTLKSGKTLWPVVQLRLERAGWIK